MFSLIFRTDNAAFEDAPELECARILREVADDLERVCFDGIVQDANGNTVGNYALTVKVQR